MLILELVRRQAQILIFPFVTMRLFAFTRLNAYTIELIDWYCVCSFSFTSNVGVPLDSGFIATLSTPKIHVANAQNNGSKFNPETRGIA